ncbi:hypothetical protein, partial [Nocardia sp. JMUB6875]|uniref:hypothetical protein n=1 Tax=Nocardia sp. JMUB6875 TaxID=3158170 RepID=UPI0034E89264
ANSVESDLRPTLLSRIIDAQVLTLDHLPPPDRETSHRRIRRTLAEIWSSGRWYSALDALARFDPRLLAEIADEAVRFDASAR